MDVVFLAYANSQASPLPNLSREDDQVFSILVNRALKGHFFIHRDSFTTLEKINEYLGKYSGSLALFLYSGHAGRGQLSLVGGAANAKGIAHQLKKAASSGKLKVVVLNGCSTAGQVEGLLNAGVPAVVATSAPVDDRSATEFSIRFFQCLSEKRLTIKDAFEEALGPAQTATMRDLVTEEISWDHNPMEIQDSNRPLWGLYYAHPEAVSLNPLPARETATRRTDFVPNEKLTQALFETLLEAGNRDIRYLHEKEEEGQYVEEGDKQTAIVNVLPFPIAAHLQKLLCPVEQENEGFDKLSRERLLQIGTAYQLSVEFLTFILLAELWELQLQTERSELPAELVEELHNYFHLSASRRAVFDYLPFLRSLRTYFERRAGEAKPFFVEELGQMGGLLDEGNEFSNACKYLAELRRQGKAQKLNETAYDTLCIEAEEKLFTFFSKLGFLHRYDLASIQNIDIQKYRHQLEPAFNHKAVKLMRAFGKPEENHYLLPNFLDNRGVVLLKGRLKVVDARKKQFAGSQLEFLNLSPFVIDRNAFEENTDLSNLLFFEYYHPSAGRYGYKNAKRPESDRDRLEILKDSSFEAVRQQLEAFRTTILNESPEV